jgi:hypothetical protein
MRFPKRPNLRQHVLSRAGVAVEKSARNGSVLNVTVEAQRIANEGKMGDLSLGQIAEDIAMLASVRGLVVEFGDASLFGNG